MNFVDLKKLPMIHVNILTIRSRILVSGIILRNFHNFYQRIPTLKSLGTTRMRSLSLPVSFSGITKQRTPLLNQSTEPYYPRGALITAVTPAAVLLSNLMTPIAIAITAIARIRFVYRIRCVICTCTFLFGIEAVHLYPVN